MIGALKLRMSECPSVLIARCLLIRCMVMYTAGSLMAGSELLLGADDLLMTLIRMVYG